MNRTNPLAVAFVWSTLTLGVLITGCGQHRSMDEPPDIVPGLDACDECRMIINEERYAAACRTGEGKAFRFDDIGCMRQYLKKHHLQPRGMWVKDYQTAGWLPASRAWFVQSKRIPTPMAYGIIALADSIEALKMVSQFHGRLLNSEQLFLVETSTQKQTTEDRP